MSESVRYFLESRVPELEDLFKKGLFSREEVKEIVNRRTKHEYKIKRRGALLDDFLAYIEYEKNLELTRMERHAKLNIRARHSVSDHSLVKYILGLYRRAVTKFRGDLDLWKGYIAFARSSNSDKAMSKILASCLQLHPLKTEFWNLAAEWELEHQKNPASARALYLRSLRVNKESKDLWLHYFSMELCVASTLAQKRFELGDKIESLSEGGEMTVFDGALAVAVFKHAVSDADLTSADIYRFFNRSTEFPDLSKVSAFISDFVATAKSDKHLFYAEKARCAIEEMNLDDPVPAIELCMRELNLVLNSSNDCLPKDALKSAISVLKCLLGKFVDCEEVRSVVFEKICRIMEAASNLFEEDDFFEWIEMAKLVHNSERVGYIASRASARFPKSSTFALLSASLKASQPSTDADFSAVLFTYQNLLMGRSKDESSITESLDSLFSMHMETDNSDLIKLAEISISKSIPSTMIVRFALKHFSKESLGTIIDFANSSSAFIAAFVTALIDTKCFDEYFSKIVAKFIILSSSVYGRLDTVCALLHYSFVMGELDTAMKIYEKAVISPKISRADLSRKYEELRDSISQEASLNLF